MSYEPGETRTVYDETTGAVRAVAVRRSNNTAAWLIAALVAVVAIIAVAFMVASANRDAAVTPADLSTVAEQARAQGALEGAQAGYNAANSQAQSSYNAAAANAQLAADRSAAEARAAAAETRAAAERARAEAAEAVAARPAPVEDPLPLN
jgi:uncharacterized membrane protein